MKSSAHIVSALENCIPMQTLMTQKLKTYSNKSVMRTRCCQILILAVAMTDLVKQVFPVLALVVGQTHSVAAADSVTFSRPSLVAAAGVSKQVRLAGKTLKSPHVLISWQSCSAHK
jgi:predicted anti-sigma-YlaC factor YlaD